MKENYLAFFKNTLIMHRCCRSSAQTVASNAYVERHGSRPHSISIFITVGRNCLEVDTNSDE
jgi:hypothetical protein